MEASASGDGAPQESIAGGVPTDAPRYSRAELDGLKFADYKKRGLTSLAPAEGPFLVSTKEGVISIPEGWTGYIALDADGDPYPVELSVAERTYEKA